jgi:hypothetical protein
MKKPAGGAPKGVLSWTDEELAEYGRTGKWPSSAVEDFEPPELPKAFITDAPPPPKGLAPRSAITGGLTASLKDSAGAASKDDAKG